MLLPRPTVSESLLKRTTSRCPVCQRDCAAEVWKRSRDREETQTVWLVRHCPEHGEAEACISSDARFYWLAQGDPKNRGEGAGSGCCGGNACSASDGTPRGVLGRNAAGVESVEGRATSVESLKLAQDPQALDPRPSPLDAPFDSLSTCLALIEIVHSCNLACPTCYADSPQSRAVDAVPLADLQARIQGVIDRKGSIEILQLSGGEPTLHPQFFELLAWCHANPGIDYVLLNTNGVRIASDAAFAEELGKTFRLGRFQLYLQFDGVQEEAQRALRGADLREMRRRTLERCRELGIPVTLAMTVTPENLPHLWKAVAFGLEWSNVRGISFQPMFTSGRVGGTRSRASQISDAGEGAERNGDAQERVPPRLNTADIILASVEQSGGVLGFDAFTPLPCGDPNCATIGYLLKTPDGPRSISDLVDFSQIQGFLRDRVRYSLDDLARCGCESEPLGRVLHELELDETHTFRLFIKPFMDAWTWDQDRIDRCCTHVIRPDGKLDSFCRYYGGR